MGEWEWGGVLGGGGHVGYGYVGNVWYEYLIVG